MERELEIRQPPNPVETASCISRLLFRDGHINDWGKKTISTAPKRRTKTFKIKVSTTLNQTTVNSARARHVYFSRLATDHKGQRAIILRSSTQGTNICSLLKEVRSPELLWLN
ncbi:hypothetical protein MRX96_039626 [Rhipicephalus microplus]